MLQQPINGALHTLCWPRASPSLARSCPDLPPPQAALPARHGAFRSLLASGQAKCDSTSASLLSRAGRVIRQ